MTWRKGDYTVKEAKRKSDERIKKAYRNYGDTIKEKNIHIMEIPEWEEKVYLMQ